MKLSLSYNFFNGEDLLYYAVKHMRPMADHISIVYQEISNIGNKISQNAREVLKKIENENLVDDLILYNPDFSLTPYQNEHNKRKLGYECAKAHNATYLLCSDADEFYKFDEFQNAKEYILNHDIKYSACHSYFYIKQPFYRSKKIGATNVCFICAIDENTIFKLNEPTPFPNIDGTRSMINKVDRKIFFREDQITMHHMNFVRKDFTSKFNNTSSRKNPHLQDFLKELEQSIVSWKFGQAFHFPQKESYEIIETDNYFDLPVMEPDISSMSNLTSEDKKEDMQNIRDKLKVPKPDSRLKHGQERKLNVFLATNHLFDYTGSEITLLTIANKMREKGHTVFVYAKYIDKNFIRVFHDIATVSNSIENLSQHQFDAAYIQHHPIALEVRHKFPTLPVFLASLGVLPFLEQPPLINIGIHKHLAISEEVKDNLIHKGIKSSSIEIFRNIVDSNKFKPTRTVNPTPLNAIVYSYKITPENLNVVQKACEALNIQCRHIGEKPGVIDQNKVAEELNKADIVFTLGRGVIETMMCGKIPIVYDYQGGDGMVTPKNIHELMSHNFSGRRYGRQYQITEMIDEIKGYNPENAAKLRELSVDLFDADKGVDQLISWLKNSTTKPIISATTERREKIRSLVELINITKEYSIEASIRALIARNDAVLKTGEGSRHEVRPPDAINTRSGVSPRVSIIIPLFNNLEFTKQCLEALIENTPDELYEVIIVDNASTDGTKDFLSTLEGDVTIIRNETNLGFAHACNQGADAAKGTFLLFLNNDTEPQKGWLEPILKILDNDPTVAAAGSKLLFPDGKIQHAGVAIIEDKKLPDPLVARHIYYQKPSNLPEANQPRTYQALTAACILIRKDSYEKAGGFDESYWNGYEDVDLCFKLQEKGWKLVYQPESIVIHHESISGPERFNKVDHNINRLHERWIGKIKPDVIINKDGSTTATDAHQIRPYILPPEFKPEIKPGRSEIRNDLASIVILTFNQLEYTKKCLQSIAQYTSVPYELIIVDNGSTDDTAQFLENYANEHVNCKVILNKENLGFAGGNNQGIAAARGDYILLLNNDVIVTRDWLELLIAHIESDENIGMVGPVSNFVSGHQLVENTGYRKNLNKMHEFAKNHFQNNVGITQDIMRLVGFCLLIKRQVLDIIGGLDENYGNGNYEDDDLCLRACIAGFRNIIAHDVFIHHYGSMTFKGNKIDYTDSLECNRRRFADKWKDIIEVNGNEYRARMTREDQLKKLLEWGEERFSQGNFNAAVKIFERVLKLDKTNSQAMNNLGVIQWQISREPASAMKIFQTALTFNPKDHDALGNLVQAATKSSRFDLINPALLNTLKKAQPANPDLVTLINAQQSSTMSA